MKTIFMTGASGLIGKELTAQLLEKGYRVIATDSKPSSFEGQPNYTFISSNIFDKSQIAPVLESGKVETLIHLACTVDNDIKNVVNDKEMGDSKDADKYIFKSAVRGNVKDIIMLSTTQIYAPQKTREPIRETAEEKPITNYAKMKSDSEVALSTAIQGTKVKAVSMRLAPIYTKAFDANLHAKIFDYKDNVAYLYGEGLYNFSLCCLYNAIDFILGILTQNVKTQYQGVYNIADTDPINANQIVEFERKYHHLGPVIQRSSGTESIKSVFSFGNKAAKNDYRYIDPTTLTYNIQYDNTKALRISTFRWNITNTK